MVAIAKASAVSNSAALQSEARNNSNATRILVSASNEFTWDLYRELVKLSSENLAVSGLSVHADLTMTYLGARGETADEMRTVLHLDSLIGREGVAYEALTGQLRAAASDSTHEIAMANALWTDERYPLRSSFKQIMAHCFQSEIEQVSFQDRVQCEHARKRINSWTDQKTHGMIPELLQSGDLEPLIMLVLSNAVYFHGLWNIPFPYEKTSRSVPFYTLDGKRISAQMMRIDESDSRQIKCLNSAGTFRAVETDSLQILELPYCNSRASMLILLPRSPSGLPEIERTFNETQLDGYLTQLDVPRGYTIAIPKFRIESSKRLNQALISLGIKKAFGSGADFSGIFERDQAFIKSVIHGTKVDVDEQGTEAAGATHILLTSSTLARGFEFNADHPFLFIVRDNATGVILFMGRVTNPAVDK
jgi:serpin B